MTFAKFLQHPLATDPVTQQTTGGYDTTQMVEATGTDSWVPLDGRMGRRRQIEEVITVWKRRRQVCPQFVGFEIHTGPSLRQSTRLYRASFESLDLASLEPAPTPAPPAPTKPGGTLHPKDTMFLRTHLGKAIHDGKEYLLSTSMTGSPIVCSASTEQNYTLSWEQLVNLAIEAGIDDPEALTEHTT